METDTRQRIVNSLLDNLDGDMLEKYRPYASVFYGNSSEKLQQLRNKYHKVIDDSTEDKSEYRIAFADVHHTALNYLLCKEVKDLEFIILSFYSYFQTKNLVTTQGLQNGKIDALYIIILELLSIIE